MFSSLSVAADASMGDATVGKTTAALCQGCHGVNGEGKGMPTGQASYPRLAGQVPAYFIKSLYDFKNGVRNDAMMSAIAKGLTEPDIANLAAYYSALK
jgi:cytochrome c553